MQAKTYTDILQTKYKAFSQQQIYNVIKILLMPIDMLVSSFKLLSEAQIKTSYKQLALVLHPDKNRFPCSQDAFMKLNRAYLECSKQVF